MVSLIDPSLPRLRTFIRWLPQWLACEAPDLSSHEPLGFAPQILQSSDAPATILGVCLASPHPVNGIHAVVRRLYAAAAQPAWMARPISLVLASPDDLGDPVLPGVRVLDAATWWNTWERHRR